MLAETEPEKSEPRRQLFYVTDSVVESKLTGLVTACGQMVITPAKLG